MFISDELVWAYRFTKLIVLLHNDIRTDKFQKSITYRGSKLWNQLPLEIQSADTLTQFKSLLAQHQKANKINTGPNLAPT